MWTFIWGSPTQIQFEFYYTYYLYSQTPTVVLEFQTVRFSLGRVLGQDCLARDEIHCTKTGTCGLEFHM